MKTGLLDRETLLAQAEILIRKDNFSHEDNARCNALMTLAERVGADGSAVIESAEMRDFRTYLFSGKFNGQNRDMTTLDGADGAYLVPQGFRYDLGVALKKYDAIFDPAVSTLFEPKSGYSISLPALDDTEAASVVVAQTVQSEQQPSATQVVSLGIAPTYRTGVVTVSRELIEDSAFDPVGFLSTAFGVRHARGVAPSLITILLAASKLGATATGDPNADGATGANSIGYQDLLALRKSVDPAYRAANKVFWLMNDDTLAAIDGLLDKQGHPIIREQYDSAGRRLLLGYPVGLCPSMPDIGSSAKPIAFGATSFFVLRVVQDGTRVQRLEELYAEFGIVGFQSYMRADGGLICASGADSPVKYLQNAS